LSSFALQEAGSTNVDPKPGTGGSDKGPNGVEAGRWKMLFQLLELPITFQIRPTERDGLPCCEAYFPSVSVQLEGNSRQELTGVVR